MKNKILFLTDEWHPHPTANATCVRNIAKVLQNDGCEIWVSAIESRHKQAVIDDEGIHVSFVRPTWARQLLIKAKQNNNSFQAKLLRNTGTALNRIRRIILLPFYPIVSFFFAHRWCKSILNIVKTENIKTVISVIAPEDSLYTGYLIKKKKQDIAWGVYCLDAGTNLMSAQAFIKIKSLLQKKAIKWDNKVFAIANMVAVMQGHAHFYLKPFYKSIKDKLVILDVPLLLEQECNTDTAIGKSTGVQRWVYAGSLKNKYYDPHLLCEVFTAYSNKNKAELHLYGYTDMQDYMQMLNANKNNNIEYHGMLAHSQLLRELKKADILVYYKMEKIDSVSGKFFEYVGFYKPIIFIGYSDDINAKNVKKYPLGLFVDINASVKDIVCSIQNYLHTIEDLKKIPIKAEEIFYLSTPQASAQAIKSKFGLGDAT